MSETPKLSLPEVASNQAQKHVTVNTAFRMLDALVQLSVKDRGLTAPPGSPAEGDTYIVAATATGAWAGLEDYVVVWDGTAWIALEPQPGWTAYVIDERTRVRYGLTSWGVDASAGSHEGSATIMRVKEQNLTLSGVTTSSAADFIPANCIVLACSCRVTGTPLGAATSYSVGVAGNTGKFGSGLGLTLGSFNYGVIGPEGFYANTPVVITAAGGSFTGGTIRVALHYIEIVPPQS